MVELRHSGHAQNHVERTCIVAIHGVGEHAPGVIAAAIGRHCHVEDDAEVIEYNWDQHVSHPYEETTERAFEPFWVELGASLGNAALLGPAFVALTSVGRVQAWAAIGLQLLQVAMVMLASAYPILGGATTSSAATILFETSIGLSALNLVLGLSPRTPYPGVSALRVIVITYVWPILAVVAILGHMPWRQVVAGAAFVLFILLLVFWAPMSREVTGNSVTLVPTLRGAAVGTLLYGVGVLVVPAFAKALISWMRERMGTLAKLLADVVKYLGNRRYREKLIGGLVEVILRAAGETNRIVLAAHSLGSVIAVDALLSIDQSVLPPNVRIDLITMGSPLRRIMCRFFGLVYLHPARLYEALSVRFAGRFRWVNVYRPSDPVGEKLELAGNDFATQQRVGALLAHVDYWSDGVVAETVRLALAAASYPSVISTEIPHRSFASSLVGMHQVRLLALYFVGACVLGTPVVVGFRAYVLRDAIDAIRYEAHSAPEEERTGLLCVRNVERPSGDDADPYVTDTERQVVFAQNTTLHCRRPNPFLVSLYTGEPRRDGVSKGPTCVDLSSDAKVVHFPHIGEDTLVPTCINLPAKCCEIRWRIRTDDPRLFVAPGYPIGAVERTVKVAVASAAATMMAWAGVALAGLFWAQGLGVLFRTVLGVGLAGAANWVESPYRRARAMVADWENFSAWTLVLIMVIWGVLRVYRFLF